MGGKIEKRELIKIEGVITIVVGIFVTDNRVEFAKLEVAITVEALASVETGIVLDVKGPDVAKFIFEVKLPCVELIADFAVLDSGVVSLPSVEMFLLIVGDSILVVGGM